MITRRSFLYGAAWAAGALRTAPQPEDPEVQGPRRHGDLHLEPVPAGYPYDRSIPAVRSRIMVPLPRRVVAGYWTSWGSPPRLTEIPTHYNTVFLFHATPVGGAPGTTGAVQWNSVGNGRGAANRFTADLAEFRRTRTAILTVGGSRQHVDLSTRTRAQTFLDSVKRIYADLGGFDGLDWNTYEGDQLPDTEQMIWISTRLKEAYGPTFAITTPPAPWRPADLRHCRAMIEAGVLDLASPQYYDGPGLADEHHIVASVNEWVQQLGDPRRVGVGFGVADAPHYSSRAAVEGAWRQLSAQHPTLRGAFNWEISHDREAGWPFAEHVAPLVMIDTSLTAAPITVPPVIPVPPLLPRRRPATQDAAESRHATGLPERIVGHHVGSGAARRLGSVPPECNTLWIGRDLALVGEGEDSRRQATPERPGLARELDLLRQRPVRPRILLSSGPTETVEEAIRLTGILRLEGFGWDLTRAEPADAGDLESASRAIVAGMRASGTGSALTVDVPAHTGSGPGPYEDFVLSCLDLIDLCQITLDPSGDADLDLQQAGVQVRRWLGLGLAPDRLGLRWTSPPGSHRLGAVLSAAWPGLRGWTASAPS